MKKILFLVILVLLTSAFAESPSALTLSEAQMTAIGKRIWNNECEGSISGLTAWNRGENFPSLGIAHCIWYPAGKRDQFEESWPPMARYLKEQRVNIASWMLGSCPWSTRAAFMADFNGPRLTLLRKLLAESVAQQARFTALRLEAALPKMLKGLPPTTAEKVKHNFYRIAQKPFGFYALIDYVNFKGEGVNPSERYNGEGWGLLQVLETMPSTGPALPEFVKAAKIVLQHRVHNSPPARNEAQWLPGWNNRLETYLN